MFYRRHKERIEIDVIEVFEKLKKRFITELVVRVVNIGLYFILFSFSLFSIYSLFWKLGLELGVISQVMVMVTLSHNHVNSRRF